MSEKELSQSTLNPITLQDKMDLMEKVNSIENKRQRVLNAVEDIRSFKKDQKALYRKYYVAAEDLHDSINVYKDDKFIYGLIKHFDEVDVTDIFFKPNNKRKIDA